MLGIDMDQNMLEREITRNLGLDSIIADVSEYIYSQACPAK